MERLKLMLAQALLILISLSQVSFAAQATLDVKRKAESEIKQIVEPILSKFCQDQCKLLSVDSEVDIAVEDESMPGFDSPGKVSLAPASAKIKVLIDKNLGSQTQAKVVNLLKENFESLKYPVQIETRATQFPQPASTNYRVAELRDRVFKDVKNNMQSLLSQLCGSHCVLGEFDLQSEIVNPEDVDYGSSQEYYQDGPAAIRVKNVKATVLVDQSLSADEATAVVEMAKLKLNQFKNVQIAGQILKFPRIDENDYLAGGSFTARGPASTSNETSKDLKQLIDNKEHTSKTDLFNRNEKAINNTNSNNSSNDSRHEKFERFEKIERVENGDAVQKVLDKFKIYGLIISAVMLALLFTLVAIGFRGFGIGERKSKGSDSGNTEPGFLKKLVQRHQEEGSGENLTKDEKASLIGKRIEADNIHSELTTIFSEQPKVAKHVFAQVITEDGIETTAQYVQLFGESIMFDLLRDPGLQSDLAELMDFYARNTFEINDEERLTLLKRLHHRTVSAKMMVHGSRSAALFDFLVDMDAPQIFEMIKNESNTVKAIVLTQCDTKKRQAVFGQHDEGNRMKLMGELTRIDHLPKNYIFNVSSALRRKKAENPKLNTEALPGTEVLISFLERSGMDMQRQIIQQLMATSGDILTHLKAKLISIETLRFVKDSQLIEVITGIKHDELLQFLQGCSASVKEAVLSKGPRDLSDEIRDQLMLAEPVNRETYLALERKIINRLKVMANQGVMNLSEVNEEMFAREFAQQSNEFMEQAS